MIALLLPIALLKSSANLGPPQGAQDKRLYTVATAHLDTNWLWTIQDTISSYLPKTLNANFEFFKEFPDYNFNFEGAWRYMLMKEYYPEQYAKLKQYVRDGRWRVTGSWVDAVDTNIPSPESLIRQCLYGNGYWKKEFGKTSNDIFLPDCFGFGYALPSIAVHCGLASFSTQKLYWGSASGIPFPVGQWQGVDGSRIIASLDPGSYGDSLPDDTARHSAFLKLADRTGNESGAYVVYRYHGTGDTGGGPSRKSVQNLERGIRAGGPLKVISAGGDQLANELTPLQKSKLPLYDGELLLTTHGTGCYTSQAAMKFLNRKNELLADSAERAAVQADWLGGAIYPRETIKDAWVHFLWHQFHDDLTGTSIPQVYPFSWNDEALSLNRFSQVLRNSAKVVASQLDTRGPGVPIVVYNPLGFDRKARVVAPFSGGVPRVTGPDGKEVPAQTSDLGVEFLSDAPPNGWAVYHVESTNSGPRDGPAPALHELANQEFNVKLDDDGDIASIFDRRSDKELLKSPIRLALFNDVSRNWPSWEITYQTETAAPRSYVDGPPTITCVDYGPLRKALRVEREKDGSRFVQEVSITAGIPRVDVENWIEWRTKGTLLKAVFNLTASNPTATYDLGLGTVQRGNDQPKKYEVPAQQWADLTDTTGSFGVSVLSESKYGWDKPGDDTLRLTLLHTATGSGNYSFQYTNDLGHHHFKYSIFGHKSDWRNGTVQEAASLNQPAVGFQTTAHSGALPAAFSLVRSGAGNLKITAIKKAEDHDETVIRVFESEGRAGTGDLNFAVPIKSAREVNGQEGDIAGSRDVSISGSTLSFSLHPYQPRAFAVKLADPKVRLSPVRSVPLVLPFNTDLVTTRAHLVGPHIDADGHSYASELFPHSLVANDVLFRLGSVGRPNALIPDRQSIRVPLGTTRVESLIASVGRADNIAGYVAPNYTNRFGQWDNRMSGEQVLTDPSRFGAPYMKRFDVAWIGTHRHNALGDEPYVYTYMFDVPTGWMPGSASLNLPMAPNARIFALTAVVDPYPAVTPTQPLYGW